MTLYGTQSYYGDYQNLSGNLTFLIITIKNKAADDHMRWGGTLTEGDDLFKGVRYNVKQMSDSLQEMNLETIGFRDFSSPSVSFEALPSDYSGVIPGSHTFIAEDNDPTNPYKTGTIAIPEGSRLSPDDTLEPGATYTIETLGGVAADNDFAGQFASVSGSDTIKVGFSFTVASETDTTEAAYEGDHFVAAEFDAGTRLVKGSLTVIEYGGTMYEEGILVPNNAIQFVLEKLATFATIAQVGPLPDPLPSGAGSEGSFVVVLENSPYRADNAGDMEKIRDKLNEVIDGQTPRMTGEDDDFAVNEFILKPDSTFSP